MTIVSKRWRLPTRSAAPYTSKAAFSRLYDETYLNVYRYVFGLIGGAAQDAEDITAQAYLKAWHSRHKFHGSQEQALGWLFTLAKHIVIDRYRKQQIRPQPVDFEEAVVMSPDTSPEEQAIKAEQVRLLWVSLHSLPADSREMLVLRYLVGWPVKDIAAHMDMNPNTVSVRLRRVLEQLKGIWQQYDEQEE